MLLEDVRFVYVASANLVLPPRFGYLCQRLLNRVFKRGVKIAEQAGVL